MSSNYTREEERELARSLRAGDGPSCPRCGVPMDRKSIPPRHEVSYVRHRVLLTCLDCGRGIALDLKPVGGGPRHD